MKRGKKGGIKYNESKHLMKVDWNNLINILSHVDTEIQLHMEILKFV